MFVVAIVSLTGTVADATPELATALGVTAFEARQLLARGLPTPVLRTPDKDRAIGLREVLRAQGNDAVAFDSASVAKRETMVCPPSLVFESAGLRAEQAFLAWDDIALLLRFIQPTRTETITKTEKRKFSPGRALATGGLRMSKTVTKERHSVEEDREQSMFIFPRGGAAPWLLSEHRLQYQCLGDEMGSTRVANFQRVVERIRGAAPSCWFDDSLTSPRRAGGSRLGEQAIDELAYLIFICLMRRHSP